jgi:hypothetical protein
MAASAINTFEFVTFHCALITFVIFSAFETSRLRSTFRLDVPIPAALVAQYSWVSICFNRNRIEKQKYMSG